MMDANNDLLSLFQQTAGTAQYNSGGLTETSTINIVRKLDMLVALGQEQNSLLRSMQRGGSTIGGGQNQGSKNWFGGSQQGQQPQRTGGLRSTAGSGFQSGAGNSWLQNKGILPVPGAVSGQYAPGTLPHGGSFAKYEQHNQVRRTDRAAVREKGGEIGSAITSAPFKALEKLFAKKQPQTSGEVSQTSKYEQSLGGRTANIPTKNFKDNAVPVWVVGGLLDDGRNSNDTAGLADTSQRDPEEKSGNKAANMMTSMIAGKIGMAIAGPIGMVAGKIISHTVGGLFSDLKSSFNEVKQSLSNIMSGFSRGAEKEMRRQFKSLADTRLAADVRAIVEKPFQIMQEAAQAVKAAWEANLRDVGQAQGYTKEAMLDMISMMSARLEQDGLSRIFDATQLTENLAGVIKSGLTGVVAEEFTYLATVLKATTGEDFFTYADTFGSIVAQELTKGRSQAEAIETASMSLQNTAGMFMAAGRELTQGIGTGLKDMKGLLDSANQIARNARIDDNSQILAALTKVSAVAGAINTQLGTGLVDAITKATTGSNEAAIVAFRALAGQGAESTQFLRDFSNNPMKIMGKIFTELAERQRMAPDAYMTVADQLAPVFNIPPDAFSGIDFSVLANAMESGIDPEKAYNKSLELLKSGETTINSAQARMAEINKQIADEGLGWLIDNDVAMMMYQNKITEQQNRDLMAATWAVEIKGETNNILQSLKDSVSSILKFLNPFGSIIAFFKKLNEVQKVDRNRHATLQAGVVGTPAQFMYSNIMSAGKSHDLQISQDYATMISDGRIRGSRINAPNMLRGADRLFHQNNNANWNSFRQMVSSAVATSVGAGFGSSQYEWRHVLGRGQGLASTARGGTNTNPYLDLKITESASEQAAQRAEKILEQVDKEAKKFVGSYDEFKTQQLAMGRNVEALSEQAGRNEEEVVNAFNEGQVEQGAAANKVRLQTEERWWKEMLHESQRIHSAVVAGTVIQSKALGYQENLEYMINEQEEKKPDSIFQKMFGSMKGMLQNILDPFGLTEEEHSMFKERMESAFAENISSWESANSFRHRFRGDEEGDVRVGGNRSQREVLEDIEESLRVHRVSFGLDKENGYRKQFEDFFKSFGETSGSHFRGDFDTYRSNFETYTGNYFGSADQTAGSYRKQFFDFHEDFKKLKDFLLDNSTDEFHEDFKRYSIQNLQLISSIRTEFANVFNVKGQGRSANNPGDFGFNLSETSVAYQRLIAEEHGVSNTNRTLQSLVNTLSHQNELTINTANPVEQTNTLLATLVKLMGNLVQTLAGGYGAEGASGDFWDMLSATSYGAPPN
jgi:hypothetical protein